MEYYTNLDIGLKDEEVIKNKEKYGSNIINGTKETTFFKKFIESLGDPIIRILLIALGIKIVFLMQDFDWYETVGIVIAIFVASLISTISEYGSEKAFIKLQEEASKIKCHAIRNKILTEIKVDEVVVGDIIKLQAGDKIPADGILMSGSLSVDESSINGETKEAYKEPSINNTNDNSKLYRGTVVYSKEGLMMVTKVGQDTLYGKLASELQEKGPDSPLKIRLTELAKVISYIGYVGAFLVSISYLFYNIIIQNNFDIVLIKETISNVPIMLGYLLYAMTLCVTVIVVAVPEGLPMMITLVLSSNMKRMLQNNVLVRKMVGIETAGSLNILFTDKTGTLTNGKLEVIGFIAGDSKRFSNEYDLNKYSILHDIVKNSILYNNSSSYYNSQIIGGNITDRALLDFIKTDRTLKYKKLKDYPFDSKNKYSYTTVDINGKKTYIKGAPELIIKKCTDYYDELGRKQKLDRLEILDKIKNYTNKGIRVLALAINDHYYQEDIFKNITLVGLILIKDEVREEAVEGVKLVQDAGIQVVMLTGDNKDTAISIAKETGILNSLNDIVLTSEELDRLTDEELEIKIPQIKVIARALPQDKSRLVKVCENMNLVVGMTGDGVNDAPALKKADVGFAMGSGTEISKEASDIVIMDDNFLSIAKAILFGRTIFKSIRKFIIVQLTINLCALTISIVGPFIGIETPVTVVQMLWVNMIMDTLAGLAFAFEPPMLEYMKEKPKKKNESIINKYMFNSILITGLYSSLLCLVFLKLPIINKIYHIEQGDKYLMTAFFGLFIFIDIFNTLNARTNRINIFKNLFQNKVFVAIISFIAIVQICLIYFGGTVFRTSGLTFFELQFMILLATTVIPIDWVRKYYLKKKGKNFGV